RSAVGGVPAVQQSLGPAGDGRTAAGGGGAGAVAGRRRRTPPPSPASRAPCRRRAGGADGPTGAPAAGGGGPVTVRSQDVPVLLLAHGTRDNAGRAELGELRRAVQRQRSGGVRVGVIEYPDGELRPAFAALDEAAGE